MQTGYYAITKLPIIGMTGIALTPKGICRIDFNVTKNKFCGRLSNNVEWKQDETKFKTLISKLKRLLNGENIIFNETFDLNCGTPFQKNVWKNIAKIPWGETISYANLARAVKRPRAYRATANACGANPFPIIIPCHRVIASDGTLGGFSSGIKLKKTLLAVEKKT